jgi:hypothetical protein
VNPEQTEEVLLWLERIHGLLGKIENRLEELERQMDLQRETVDSVLVNAMEIADRTGKGASD